MTSDNKPLNNLTVLVTRPAALADNMCRLIEQAGGCAIAYPVISIEAPADRSRLDALLAAFNEFDIAIFISPSAVRKTFELVERCPAGPSVAAIGSSTRAHLEQRGVSVDIAADGHDSESLLTHPALQAEHLSGKKIIIFRGEGGRALLGDTLAERGAQVEYAEAYRRARPANAKPLTAEQLNAIDIITVTSAEGLANLAALSTDSGALVSIPVCVPGARVAEKARQQGFSTVITADSATDQALLQAVIDWRSRAM